MAYDEALADRIRRALGPGARVTEIKMFGGLCFMVRGHMTCGVMGDELMLRVGVAGANAALELEHARPMDFTGRPMAGMIYVSREGCSTQRAVERWVARGMTFNATLGDKKRSKESQTPRFPRRKGK
jgi:TfoX/Sxy family transcriptional regulator of competence genes